MLRFTSRTAGAVARLTYALATILLVALATTTISPAITPPLAAQATDEAVPAYAFADVRWGTGKAALVKHLAERGFRLTKTTPTGDLHFTGKRLGYRADVVAFLTPSGVQKFTVGLITPDDKARPVYAEMKESLIEKYGEATQCVENFVDPYYDGDGYEEQAFRLGKAHSLCLWGDVEDDTAPKMAVGIEKNLIVTVQYESKDWASEMEKRRKRGKRDF